MAASGEETLVGQLDQLATCPICLDFMEQPMVLSCGHSFCRRCLAHLGTQSSCPLCRVRVKPKRAYPNQLMANLVCHLKRRRHSEGAQEESSVQQLCQEHRQPLQIFCSSEKNLLCLACLREHQGHSLLSLPEAAQEYKDLLDGLQEPLRKEEQKLLEQRQAEEQSRQEFQEQLAAEKQKLGLVLESLQQLLRERKLGWLDWLAKQEEEMEAEWTVALDKLSREISRLQQLMAQMERKCRQPNEEFLQDIQDTVDRCQSYVVGSIESASPRLQVRLQALLEKNTSVRWIVDNSKASQPLTRENLERLLTTAAAPEQSRSPKVGRNPQPDTRTRASEDQRRAPGDTQRAGDSLPDSKPLGLRRSGRERRRPTRLQDYSCSWPGKRSAAFTD